MKRNLEEEEIVNVALLSSINIGLTDNTARIDTTVTNEDSEVTCLTPVRSPRVGNQPVFFIVFFAPSDDLNGVTTKDTTGSVSVDTTLVGHEIFVDLESTLNRTVLHKFSLHGVDAHVPSSGEGLGEVFLSGRTISTGALSTASRDVNTITRDVRVTFKSGDTSVLKTSPGESKHTTVATHVSNGATDKVLRGEDNIDLSFGGNAHSVSKSFSSTESPARSAVELVEDVVLALWPLFVGGEVLGKNVVGVVSVDTDNLSGGKVNELGTDEGLQVSNSPVGELVVGIDFEGSSLANKVSEAGTEDLLFRSDEVGKEGSDFFTSTFVVSDSPGSRGGGDFGPDFLSVNKKTSGDLVDEGSGVLELSNSFNETLDLATSNLADFEGFEDLFEGGTKELNTSNNLFGVLTDEVVDGLVDLDSDGVNIVEANGKLAVVSLDGKSFNDTSDEEEGIFNGDNSVCVGIIMFAAVEEDLGKGLSDVKTEFFPVTGVESIDSGEDFVVDINTVDQEVLEGVEDQGGWVRKSLKSIDKDLDIAVNTTAALEGDGKVLEGFTKSGKSTSDISGILFLKVFDGLDDVSDGIFGRRNAWSNIGPFFSDSDTFDNTLGDLGEIVNGEGKLARAGDSNKA